MSTDGTLANHQNASGLRCPSTGARAVAAFEPPPIPKKKPARRTVSQESLRRRGKGERELPPLPEIPVLRRPRQYWAPRPEPEPLWKQTGFESLEAWRDHIAKRLPAKPYIPKLPRIRIVSGGLPGLGRRR